MRQESGETPPLDEADWINLADVEAAARQSLPAAIFDYYSGGACDELTLATNRRAYERLELRPRILRDVAERSLAAPVGDQALDLPAMVAPIALQGLAHRDAELATARAAAAAGTVMVLSTLSTASVEAVAATGAPTWFQLYVSRDRGWTQALVERAESAGCGALVLTADAQFCGLRERDLRNAFTVPDDLTLPHAKPVPGNSGADAYRAAFGDFDPSLSWADLEALCANTRLPVYVKGVLHPEDAKRALASGAGGVIVSNHGGRQLDGAPATIDVLPEVVAAVAGQCPVLVDGGVRRGTDVVKALALGADAVLLGRPVIWALAAAGESGVRRMLALMHGEIDLAMALCGARTVDELRGLDIVAG